MSDSILYNVIDGQKFTHWWWLYIKDESSKVKSYTKYLKAQKRTSTKLSKLQNVHGTKIGNILPLSIVLNVCIGSPIIGGN